MNTEERTTGLEATIAELRAQLAEVTAKRDEYLNAAFHCHDGELVHTLKKERDSLRAELETLREEHSTFCAKMDESLTLRAEREAEMVSEIVTENDALRAENERLREENDKLKGPMASEGEGMRPHLLASAGDWFRASRKEQDKGKSGMAVMCMENAYNHVENALHAERQSNAQLTARIAVLEFALYKVLASAHPSVVEHPTMYLAWVDARKALNQPRE